MMVFRIHKLVSKIWKCWQGHAFAARTFFVRNARKNDEKIFLQAKKTVESLKAVVKSDVKKVRKENK